MGELKIPSEKPRICRTCISRRPLSPGIHPPGVDTYCPLDKSYRSRDSTCRDWWDEDNHPRRRNRKHLMVENRKEE